MNFKLLRYFSILVLMFSGQLCVAASKTSKPHSPKSPAIQPNESSTSSPMTKAAINASPSIGDGFGEEQLRVFDDIVNAEIVAQRIPGAVVLIGQSNKIIYRRAFGLRSFDPQQKMTPETIFDLASVTKAFVTTTAIMQLAEKGKINLDSPASKYWPGFSGQNKELITVRQLLTHTSGLPAGIVPGKKFKPQQVLAQITRVKHVAPSGQQVMYSDLNFITLGKIVANVSGTSLSNYAAKHIFEPLHLNNTGYIPNQNPLFTRAKRALIAPTVYPAGELHDPLARALGGVAGNAGVFSNADDLAIFVQALLNGGAPILSRASLKEMFTPQLQTSYAHRGLGWRTDPVFSSNRAALPYAGAVSHLGYTGTGIWIDPVRNLFVVVLTSRTLMPSGGDAGPVRAKIVNALAQLAGPIRAQDIIAAKPELSRWLSPYVIQSESTPVLTGIDVLEQQQFSSLKNKRIALLTNNNAVDQYGRRTADVLFNAPEIKVVKLFGPEHGLGVDQEGLVKDNFDQVTQLPVVSLYGSRRKPTADMLMDLDAIVVDLQDVGVRFYTYASTIAYLLEATAPLKIPIIILDRPNPVDAISVQGPVLDQKLRSFTGYWSIPVRHGMTMGELAELFVGEAKIPAILRVVPMQNYVRSMHYDDTGVPFVPPSPNLSTLDSLTLYPGIGMIEGANLSVGRGTRTPFEVIGAPWINGEQLSNQLNKLAIPGVQFQPAQFTPEASPYAGKLCQGTRITIVDRKQINTPDLGLTIAATLWKMYPEKFALKSIIGGVGSQAIMDKMLAGGSIEEVKKLVEPELLEFKKVREKYLLYP